MSDDPKMIGSSVEAALNRLRVAHDNHRKKVQEAAEPGESFEEAKARLRQEPSRARKLSSGVVKSSVTPSVRTPPKGDEQADFFVPALYDVGTRDSRSIMDVAVFRLSKKERRAGEVIVYELSDGNVKVSAGPAGMASVWDYDLVLMAISHLTDAMNRYREGKGDKPSRVFRPHVGDVLKFLRRADGGKQKDDLIETCLRLNTTHVAIQRTKKGKNGRTYTVSEGEPLISRYKVISNSAGRPEHIEIELAQWMYQEVTEGKNPDVLTVHPDYFLIDPGIGRFLYRLARRAAGRSSAKWSFQTIFERSGSTGTFKKFCFNVRKLIEANDLPEYTLTEEPGQNGPLLVMTHRLLLEGQAGS
ncbi:MULTISPECIES: replication initiator protein A [Xanthomonas]|uniref:replication initiator protein A n=1 Tax=Xanthomonas TaxID=338 RepID=UPI00115C8E85|nr:replication initiator protein A [Xanthomonas perforans]MBZ2574368.1 replication initiator protein A [Xanthomonas perforans]MBZ3027342.1 replication initiator protein A [Xanthomonas perforans]MBZ3036028.1 replication initiator protein A [Xanthomonas perforans]MBZ3048162.1 replication initiator protein A [Xanthomonas perforans]TQS95032.1 replication protein RepA [Xanthomonas perforans]